MMLPCGCRQQPPPAAIMSFAEQMFAKIDVDKGGSISSAEWTAMFKAFDKDGNIANT